MRAVPNLFRTWTDGKAIERYYGLYLDRLQVARHPERMVEVCRSIRRFASRQGSPRAGLFTFWREIHAYEALGDTNAMWRALCAWERMALGKRIDLASHRWRSADAHQLLFFYAPLLYLRHRYRLGCRLLEAALRMHSRAKGWSFELLWHVYKPIQRPSTISDVTLKHFYDALGRNLRDWPLWYAFVDGFHPKLFRLSGVSRDCFRKDPALLQQFFEWISVERERRLFTHTTMGEIDLLDNPAKVKRRQMNVAKKISRILKDPRSFQLEEKLKETFPELVEMRRG